MLRERFLFYTGLVLLLFWKLMNIFGWNYKNFWGAFLGGSLWLFSKKIWLRLFWSWFPNSIYTLFSIFDRWRKTTSQLAPSFRKFGYVRKSHNISLCSGRLTFSPYYMCQNVPLIPEHIPRLSVLLGVNSLHRVKIYFPRLPANWQLSLFHISFHIESGVLERWYLRCEKYGIFLIWQNYSTGRPISKSLKCQTTRFVMTNW